MTRKKKEKEVYPDDYFVKKTKDNRRVPYNIWIIFLSIMIVGLYTSADISMYKSIRSIDNDKYSIVGYDELINDLRINYKEGTNNTITKIYERDRDIGISFDESGNLIFETEKINVTENINPSEFAEIKLRGDLEEGWFCWGSCSVGPKELSEGIDYLNINVERDPFKNLAIIILWVVIIIVLIAQISLLCSFINKYWWKK